MSDFKELVKSFAKTREYVRDFFVYGFKTRDEFKDKSPRTYDNERRRLESWLGPYVRKDYVSNGSNISLAIDSSLLETNPLYQVWKTKSFTDNDIVLHFLILDLLQDGMALTAEEITDHLLMEYEVMFDTQTVRRKCNAYEKEGLLSKKRQGKKIVFSMDTKIMDWMKDNPAITDALSFYQLAGCFGIIGNEICEQLDTDNQIFRIKHSFFVHTLEDEILLKIIDAMNRKVSVKLEIKGSKKSSVNILSCIPMQIFTSTRSGRRFLCSYVKRNKRFTCFRLDTIKKVTLLKEEEEYLKLRSKLDKNRKYLWGVSFQNEGGRRLDKLTMVIHVKEPYENYIVERLRREGRGGTVTRLGQNRYQYETEVFDCNEMVPWIRTFIGRIVSLKCTSRFLERRFYQDFRDMCMMYQINDPPEEFDRREQLQK